MNDLFCRDETRRDLDRENGWTGIDWVEISRDQLRLCIHFILGVPQGLKPENFVIHGGVRVKDIRVKRVIGVHSEDNDPCLQVEVNKPGDLSTYTICLVGLPEKAKLDPRYACAEFTFKAHCPSELDCRAGAGCAEPERREPEIDYLAKDYSSFRQLMLDRLALVMPDWKERHVPDVGIALVEVFAYVADYLSYQQDAVATEAYLDTARLRISVRRHARLVDYAMHEGCNARAWIVFATGTDRVLDGDQVRFLTPLEDKEPAVFTPLLPAPKLNLFEAHNEIEIYTWQNEQCCLEKGATSATLVDAWLPVPEPEPQPYPQYEKPPKPYAKHVPDYCPPDEEPPPRKRTLGLHVGDFLLFEELLCATTGGPADRTRRHVVRLTRVTEAVDPVVDQPVLEVEWAKADALPFPLCITAIGPPPDCALLGGLAIARGNVVLAQHGRPIAGESLGIVPAKDTSAACESEGELEERILRAARYRPVLFLGPVSFAEAPAPDASASALPDAPASALILQNPRTAVPRVSLVSIPPAPRDAVFEPEDLDDPQSLAARVKRGEDRNARLLRRHLSAETVELLTTWDGNSTLPADARSELIQDLRRLAVEGVQPEPLFDVDDLDDPTGLAFRLQQALDSGAQTLRGRLSDEELTAIEKFDGKLSNPLHAALTRVMQAFLERWTPQSDLLGSTASDAHFVVEVDDDGRSHLRFGNGDTGREPEPGTAFIANYFAGNGPDGNIGAETLTRLVTEGLSIDGAELAVRNPLAATGGIAPEPTAEVKAYAPRAFRLQRQRAITSDDYAELAAVDRQWRRHADIQKTAAELTWNGSWPVASISLDPVAAAAPDVSAVEERVRRLLHRYRRMGHDIEVEEGRAVPLEVELDVCAQPHHARADVRRALMDVFAKFFHPDNLTFGDAVYVSRIIAAAQQVPGVASVTVKTLRRLFARDNPDFENGLLRMGRFEIPRLDRDPDSPENGLLTIHIGGGR